MDLKICTYNVRGLGNKTKRENVFAWLKDKQYSICLLQETHSGEGTHRDWVKEWGKDAFFSGTSNNSEGVGILINPKLSFSIKRHSEIIIGRLHALELNIEERDTIILNLYGPNTDSVNYFEILEKYLKENEDKTFIIGGDFNTIIDTELDKKNGRTDTHKLCRNKLSCIIDEFDLVDIWRSKHPSSKKYTWHSSSKPPIFCRLDYFLISDNLINNVISCEQGTSYRSDHSPVILNVNLTNIDRGPGYFKLNNSFILDNEYQEGIRKSITETTTFNENANPNTLWELIKGSIRNETIKYGTKKKKENNNQEIKLKQDIENIENNINNTLCNINLDDLKQELDIKKTELNELIDHKMEGHILRAKAQIIEEGEKNSQYFANLEKKKAENKVIKRLSVNNNIITEQKDILKEKMKFYQKLYSKHNQTNSKIEFFDNNINKLNNIEQNTCDGLLNEEECKIALKEMKNNKSPGSDGITTEFYKIFWNDIKKFYINSLNHSYQCGALTELQNQSIISLIPKSDKDTSILENWRPISLLNVDYKIKTKTIANRFKKVLPKLIHDSQTGFLRGRNINENIRTIFEILDYVEEKDIPGLIFFSDFEKAFDSINHDYLFKSLKHFNFSEDFIKWIKLFYSNARSCVTNNGFLSPFFSIQRGVRQGCPLSPYFFILCIELLTNQIRNNENISGINICGFELKNACYADDASFILDGSKKSFETLVTILENFSNISGLKLNTKNVRF